MCSWPSSTRSRFPGVNNAYLLKAALNAIRKQRGEPELDAFEFLGLVRQKLQLMQMDESLLNRGVNEGFLRRREESATRSCRWRCSRRRSRCWTRPIRVSTSMRSGSWPTGSTRMRDPARSIVLVTHYQRLLTYVVPDVVHVLLEGRILRSGDAGLALELEERGYDWVRREARVA